MLIIERRAGELIRIGDEVQICVLENDGDTVRIGITAPRDLPIEAIDRLDDSRPLVEQASPEKGHLDDESPFSENTRAQGGLPESDDSV